MTNKLDKNQEQQFDKAELTARLAYLESSLTQFELLKKTNGENVYVNNEPVFKYKEKIENYDLYLIELPREVKRQMVEEHVGTKPSGVIQKVQEKLREPEQVEFLSGLLKVQKNEDVNNESFSDFVIVGPSIETSFRILMIVIRSS